MKINLINLMKLLDKKINENEVENEKRITKVRHK